MPDKLAQTPESLASVAVRVPSARRSSEQLERAPGPTAPGAGPSSAASESTAPGSAAGLGTVGLDSVEEAVIVTNSAGLITSWNDAAVQLYGIDRVDALGRPAHLIIKTDFVGDGDPDSAANRNAMEQLALRLLADGSWNGQVHQYRRDGSTLDIQLTVSLLMSEANQIAGSALILRDITSALRARQALIAQERIAQSVLDSLPSRTAVIDQEGLVIAVNAEWRQYVRETESEDNSLGSNYLAKLRLQSDPSARKAVAGIEAVLRQRLNDFEMDYEYDEKYYGRNRPRTYSMHVMPLRTETGGAVISHVDITWRKSLERQLSHRATHDGLTDLPNRLLLGDRLGQALARAARSGDEVAVLFCDLDRFKDINDTLGHAVGDQVLVAVARRLRDCCRKTDWVTRFGGDEFVVVLENVSDQQVVLDIATRIRESIIAPVVIDGRELFFGVSVGVSIARGTTGPTKEAVEHLLRDADTAMYRAKEAGRNRVEVFDIQMRERATTRLSLLTDLRRAVERDQLVIEFQPQFSVVPIDQAESDPIDQERIIGAEALARWNHPERGLLGPAEFIETAEEIGVICDIGEWMINQSLVWLARWLPLVASDFFVSVNLSPLQLSDPELPNRIRNALQRHGVAPARLCLEITESGLMDNPDLAVNVLRLLHRLGVRIAVDDFGTGYSSLWYLNSLPVDILKIDRSFISAIGTGQRTDALIRGIVELSHALGLISIAEGVETLDQLTVIRQSATTAFQGFLRARPMAPEALTQLLESRCKWRIG